MSWQVYRTATLGRDKDVAQGGYRYHGAVTADATRRSIQLFKTISLVGGRKAGLELEEWNILKIN